MKLTLVITALVCALGFADVAEPACNGIRVRREIRSLSYGERQKYFHAIKRLNSGTRPNRYDYYTNMHLAWASRSHGDARFLPWHRMFIREFEKDLQRQDPSIVLPYWDWARDAANPTASDILSARLYGSNGSPGDRCVRDGVFAGWRVWYPTPHCLQRNYDRGNSISPWWGYRGLTDVINTSANYDTFRRRVEGPHGSVHVSIGGDFAPMHSPNDPLFWLHHAFVDKLWSSWQQRHNPMDYGGLQADGRPSFANQGLGPFNRAIGQVLNTQSDDLCYRYDSTMLTDANTLQSNVTEPIPDPLPEWYIKMQNMNLTEIRMFEDRLARVTLNLQ